MIRATIENLEKKFLSVEKNRFETFDRLKKLNLGHEILVLLKHK